MNTYIYGHGGSGNHGCEALARTTIDFIKRCGIDNITLVSSRSAEDIKYISSKNINIVQGGLPVSGKTPYHFLAKAFLSTFKTYYFYDRKEIQYLRNNARDSLCFSIGGDNYCYDDYSNYCRMNKYLKNKNNTLVFWGCSVEPKLLMHSDIIEDFNRYSLITARESLTYQAMIDAGLKNVMYCPDSAFLLPTEEIELPAVFNYEVVGINVSPMILKFENDNKLTMANYIKLIQHLLSETNYCVALIPHVIWKNSDDLQTLFDLYETFKDNERVAIIDENRTLNCCQLKYLISKCKFLVTARTHASIAAYSTGVPTLVTGYSVKAKGIAKDIFGDYQGYVCPVQELSSENDLLNDYLYVVSNQEFIRQKLQNFNTKIYNYFKAVEERVKTLTVN